MLPTPHPPLLLAENILAEGMAGRPFAKGAA